MNLLLSLAAGLVGCFYINRLDKLSESVRGKLSKFAVSLYPLDKLLQILCLSFLFFNNLLQTYDLSLEVFLFLGVALVHHGKAFVINLSRYIVLIGTNEQAVKFTDSLLSLCQRFLCIRSVSSLCTRSFSSISERK